MHRYTVVSYQEPRMATAGSWVQFHASLMHWSGEIAFPPIAKVARCRLTLRASNLR